MPELLQRKRLDGDIARLGVLQRSFTVERSAINQEARTVELSFSSEEPYERWFGTEILDHAASSVRLGRLKNGGAVLVNHDMRDQVAVVEQVSIGSDRKGRALVRFGKSQRADEIFNDVVDGIRGLTSVGYAVHEMKLEKSSDDGDVYRVTDWEPYELSLVSVPADPTVGVGRAAAEDPQHQTRILKENTMAEPVKEKSAGEVADIKVVQDQARDAETARVRGIVATGAQFNMKDLADQYVREGKSVAEFQNVVLAEVGKQQTAGVKETRDIGLSEKDVKNYSLMRAIRALVDKNWQHAGFERECHEAVVKQSGIEAQHQGFLVPWDVQARLMLPLNAQRLQRQDPGAVEALLKRDLTAASASGGGYLVATDNLAASFIELLRARAKVVQLGARMLPGLQGNVTIPKLTAAGTAYWLSTEATAITESNQTFGQLALTPKNVGAYTEISRQLMMQSNPAADMLVMDDINKVLALAIDSAALNGSGASGQPTGVINTAGIGAVTGTSLNWPGIVEFETDVTAANADVENMAYLTTPSVRGLLKSRDKTGTTVGNYVWGGTNADKNLNGYRAEVSTQVPAANMLFGDWSNIVIAEWGTLEIAVNPYANFAAGITGIRGWATVDIGVRQAAAFSLATGIS